MVKWVLFVFLLAASASSHAIDNFELPQDPELLKRYQALSEELRCLVCQNQNLADSNAELATDLKKELVALLQQGQSDQQIRDFVVARYGDFALYRPPVNRATAMLWFAPLLGVGGIALIMVLLWRRSKASEAHLTASDPKLAQALKTLRNTENNE